MMTSNSFRALVLACSVLVGVSTARSQTTIVYNNINSIVGFQANGGATSATGNTALAGDDLTFLSGYAGFKATAFTLAIDNNSSAAITATVTAEFFAADGASGGPGTLLGSATSLSTLFPASPGSLTNVVISGSNLFTVPATGKIWATFYFTGVSGTLASLNSLGVYNEKDSNTNGPTIGSSTASYFLGSAPATAGSNAGTIMTNPNTGVNFGLSVAVPEPSGIAMMAVGGIAAVGLAVRRRIRWTA